MKALEMDYNESEELIIQLHDIARKVERDIGEGMLADDIRKCGDRLATLNQPTGLYLAKSNAKKD